MNNGITPELLRQVLQTWNIIPDGVAPISARANLHWSVQCARDAFVLRTDSRRQTDSSIRYELDILGHLRERGWPVATSIGDVVWHEGWAFVLFPLLPGRPYRSENEQQQRHRGRILAELHRDFGALVYLGQRSGWQRLDEIVMNSEKGLGYLDAHLLNRMRPDLLRPIVIHLERVHDRFGFPSASGLPVTTVHGDLIAQNLLFQHGTLSGILDFDSAHLDLRAADVACARRGGNDGVVRGYLEVMRLSDAELTCLDDLWRASILRYALQILDREASPGPAIAELEWCVQQLEKTRPFRA